MSDIDRIFPRWAASWGLLARSNALVRSQCKCCGLQQRVDASVQALRFGGNASPVDQLDKCNVVGCHGTIYFMVARTYGRDWITMLSRDDLRDTLASAAPAVNAVSLDLVRLGQQRG
ncbi:hypothetical protein SAMN02927924_04694 [Sphingobium faniae]|jgi:hypothetical protein|nr:hypothetical protein SAMN02927924_04694 [Sphingobium faniae]